MPIHLPSLSKTAVFRGPGIPLDFVDIPIPALRSGEILIRNAMTTLCRSDLTTFAGKRTESVPTILGHEVIGHIAAFGPDAARLDMRGTPIAVGDRVTWAIFACDPSSEWSRRGMPQKSVGRFKYGHEPLTEDCTLHGGLSEYTVLRPHTSVIRLGDEVPVQVGAMVNCAVATVAGALRMAGDLGGRSVLVSGAGMLGVLACAMAKRNGASRIWATDIQSERLEIARAMGADGTIRIRPEQEQAYAELASQDPFDVVIEVTGVPSAMENTLERLNVGGTAVWVGACYPARRVEIDAEHVLRNLLTIRGLHNYNHDDFRVAAEFVEHHHRGFPLRDLVHDDFRLEDANLAFQCGLESSYFRVGVHLTDET